MISRDRATELVEAAAREIVAEGRTSEAMYPMDVFLRVRERHPEVEEYFEAHYAGDSYQAMKRVIPDDLGFPVT